MRVLVISICALALMLSPAAGFAQNPPVTQPPTSQPPTGQPPTGQPPTGQPPTGQPPTGQPPTGTQPATPAPTKVPFTTPAGILLVQIKPDKTAVFEEMASRLRAGLAKTSDETLKKQAAGFKIYKSTEPFGANALYVVVADPAVAGSEYDLFQMLGKTMTDQEKQAPETADMWKRYIDAFAAGLSKLSLTPLGGGQ